MINQDLFYILVAALGVIIVLVIVAVVLIWARNTRTGPRPDGWAARRRVNKRAANFEKTGSVDGNKKQKPAKEPKPVKPSKGAKAIPVSDQPARKRRGYQPPLVDPARLEEVMVKTDQILQAPDPAVEEDTSASPQKPSFPAPAFPQPKTAPTPADLPKDEPEDGIVDDPRIPLVEPAPEVEEDSEVVVEYHAEPVRKSATVQQPAKEKTTKANVPENPLDKLFDF